MATISASERRDANKQIQVNTFPIHWMGKRLFLRALLRLIGAINQVPRSVTPETPPIVTQ